MDQASEIESVVLAVEQFLRALDSRSWPAFEACFSTYATVSLAEVPHDDSDVIFWQIIRQGWRQVFSAELSRIGPLDPDRGRPIIELRGSSAYVSFLGVHRREHEEPAMSLRLVEGHWLIRHLNVPQLPLRAVAGPAARPRAVESATGGLNLWFVSVLVTSLIAIALLGTFVDRRNAVQIWAAVLAVFFGAVTVLRGEPGAWMRDASGRDVSLTGSGALGIAVGAAFLVT